MAGGTVDAIEGQLRETKEFLKTDEEYFSDLMQGVLTNLTKLEEHIQTCLDRPLKELSPVEFAILLMSTYEITNHPEIPYRAIINEAVELAKTYGGVDGYKYVNGVLDKLAMQLRAAEVKL
jgi:N utilization substance protein B